MNGIPKRSKPSWMMQPSEQVSEDPTGLSDRQPQAQPLPARSASSHRFASPVSKKISRTPATADLESQLVSRYISRHMICMEELEFIERMRKQIYAACGVGVTLVGSHAAGTASKQNSMNDITFVVSTDCDKSVMIERLNSVGSTYGWTVSAPPSPAYVVHLVCLNRPDLVVRVITNELTGTYMIRRTLFVRVHTQLIEPKMAIALGLIREILYMHMGKGPLIRFSDDVVFHVIWKALTEKRLIPNVLNNVASHNLSPNGKVQRDYEIWRNSDLSGTELRTAWKKDGFGVVAHSTVVGMIRMFREKVLELGDLSWANTCPVTGSEILDDGVTTPYGGSIFLRQLHAFVCRTRDVYEFISLGE